MQAFFWQSLEIELLKIVVGALIVAVMAFAAGRVLGRRRVDVGRAHHRFLIENRGSIWVAFMIGIVAATMMQGNGVGGLLAMIILAALLVLMRWVAHVEGRHDR
jgi:hypothetical protein